MMIFIVCILIALLAANIYLAIVSNKLKRQLEAFHESMSIQLGDRVIGKNNERGMVHKIEHKSTEDILYIRCYDGLVHGPRSYFRKDPSPELHPAIRR